MFQRNFFFLLLFFLYYFFFLPHIVCRETSGRAVFQLLEPLWTSDFPAKLPFILFNDGTNVFLCAGRFAYKRNLPKACHQGCHRFWFVCPSLPIADLCYRPCKEFLSAQQGPPINPLATETSNAMARQQEWHDRVGWCLTVATENPMCTKWQSTNIQTCICQCTWFLNSYALWQTHSNSSVYIWIHVRLNWTERDAFMQASCDVSKQVHSWSKIIYSSHSQDILSTKGVAFPSTSDFLLVGRN